MEQRPAHDVQPEQYATVIRELIRHENDLTNHRTMWLLVSQGFLVNAYVIVKGSAGAANTIALAGILVTLSAFIMLYKSYQARGYLSYLGEKAKQGSLREIELPVEGWPARRAKGWRKGRWLFPWLERPGHLLETYILLPVFSITLWMSSLLGRWLSIPIWGVSVMAFVLTALTIWILLVVLVGWQRKNEEDLPEEEKFR
ncbi:hypothetical protein [Geomonas sp.]|uniref:hypothetical protein n=1 Tax=Geomonas sp. TaxID=2651584 RepID=UPI002B492DEA|nr:hypothetical protein [Geomonas sp.]